MRPLLLLSRPDTQARDFAAQAQAALPAHDVRIAPLSEIFPVPFDAAVFDGAAGVVLTSVNAVPSVAALGAMRLPAWCVGPATAKAAQAAGFMVHEGGGDAVALIATLTRAQPAGPLVHAHGVHVARDLVEALRPEGLNIRDVVVYEARGVAWTEGVLDAVHKAAWVIAPLFSPRGAVRFVQQMHDMRPPGLRLVAISEACAARLPRDLRARTEIAPSPDADGMLQAIGVVMSQPRGDGLRQALPQDK